MMTVAGVVGVVVVVVVGSGGGEQLLYMGSPRAHVWSQRKQNLLFFVVFLFFLFFISNAHVWFKCPCMLDSRRKKGWEGGVPLHSEIIVREKVVGLKYLY